jgi:hypothetical protein
MARSNYLVHLANGERTLCGRAVATVNVTADPGAWDELCKTCAAKTQRIGYMRQVKATVIQVSANRYKCHAVSNRQFNMATMYRRLFDTFGPSAFECQLMHSDGTYSRILVDVVGWHLLNEKGEKVLG